MEAKALEQSQPKSREARNSNRGGWITFPFIIAGIGGLSLAQSGALSNLLVYLVKKYNMKSIDAVQMTNIVSGCISLTPVAGAILADAFFGCYPIIVWSSIISVVSMILFTLTAAITSLRPAPCAFGSAACEAPSMGQLTVLYAALVLICVGAGGVRFNILTMGAGQFDKARDRDVFFNWFFLTLYAGTIVGATAVVFVQDSISWTWGYGLAAAANVATVAFVLFGAKYYRQPPVRGSPFTALARVVVAAARKCSLKAAPQDDLNHYHGAGDNAKPTSSFRFLNRAAWICDGDAPASSGVAKPKPWRLCTVEEVEDLKDLLRIFPLWSSNVYVSISIGTQLSLSVLQVMTMDRSLGGHFALPAGSIVVASFAASIIALSVLDRFVYPLWRRLARRGPTTLQRVGVGHVINMAAMAASALVERKRAGVVRAHGMESEAGWVVPMTAMWLVLPLGLAGAGEALHFPGQVAFYYQEFPQALKSTATAMMAVLMALGYYLGAALVDLVRRATSWLPDNVNASRLENVFWLVTALAVVNFGYFVSCAWMYRYRQAAPDGINVKENGEEDGIGDMI